MNLRAAALGLAALAILPAIAPAAFAPTGDETLRLSRLTLPPADAALAIVEPSLGFSDAEAAALYEWVFAGGNLLLADDSVIGVDLTARMGAPVQLLSARLYSPVFSETPDRIPLLDLGTIPGLPPGLTTSRPILIVGGHDAVLVPSLTWTDRNDNGRPDLGETIARGSILSVVDIGAGLLVILSDPSLYDRDVREALHFFVTDSGARELVVDASHGTRVDPYGMNTILTQAPPRTATFVLLATAAVLVFLVIARPAFVRVAPRRVPRAEDELVRKALSELE